MVIIIMRVVVVVARVDPVAMRQLQQEEQVAMVSTQVYPGVLLHMQEVVVEVEIHWEVVGVGVVDVVLTIIVMLFRVHRTQVVVVVVVEVAAVVPVVQVVRES
jgi:hypothetical protein